MWGAAKQEVNSYIHLHTHTHIYIYIPEVAQSPQFPCHTSCHRPLLKGREHHAHDFRPGRPTRRTPRPRVINSANGKDARPPPRAKNFHLPRTARREEKNFHLRRASVAPPARFRALPDTVCVSRKKFSCPRRLRPDGEGPREGNIRVVLVFVACCRVCAF